MSKVIACLARTLACLALAGLSACGGRSNPTGPTPTPAPTPRPTPVTTTVRQSTFTGLEPNFALSVTFPVDFTGDVQITVDWTFGSNNIDLIVARGGPNPCLASDGFLDFGICDVVATQATSNKPERLAAQLAAGQYTLYIRNRGSSREALSYQILLTYTPSAGGAGAGLSVLNAGSALPRPHPMRFVP